MKTYSLNNALIFKKDSLVELNSHDMRSIDGGILPFLAATAAQSSWPCGIAIGGAVAHLIHTLDY